MLPVYVIDLSKYIYIYVLIHFNSHSHIHCRFRTRMSKTLPISADIYKNDNPNRLKIMIIIYTLPCFYDYPGTESMGCAGRTAVLSFDQDVKLKKELGIDSITFDVPKVLMTKCALWGKGNDWAKLVVIRNNKLKHE